MTRCGEGGEADRERLSASETERAEKHYRGLQKDCEQALRGGGEARACSARRVRLSDRQSEMEQKDHGFFQKGSALPWLVRCEIWDRTLASARFLLRKVGTGSCPDPAPGARVGELGLGLGLTVFPEPCCSIHSTPETLTITLGACQGSPQKCGQWATCLRLQGDLLS